MNRIHDQLIALYGETIGTTTHERLKSSLDRHTTAKGDTATRLRRGEVTERDALLITYADQVRESNTLPLRTLADFCNRHLSGVVSGIHLLPFYPSSSDDGFSVVDYRQVDPALGDWTDVARVGRNFRLMFDGVINHVSARSAWFQAFLRDDPIYRDYFIVVDGDPDLSQVVRPRALPVLTSVVTPSGEKKVWTTFSPDQIDLNYHNPDVVLDIIDTLLLYIERGAEFIRLDAIAYLWKEIGTTCIHLPQTHRVIQLLRAVLDEVAPQVLLITETNVPHQDNVAYFGDGENEAQLVYNFALPPLILHTFHTGDARILAKWAANLSLPSKSVTFFNFLASHDGIGLNPARSILSDDDIDALVVRALAHGGLVSYKHNPDGTRSPYELNINYFDALSDPQVQEPLALQIDRFVAAHASMLSLIGVPGLYFHSLFGSRGWLEGVPLTGHNRSINRQKIERATLEQELNDPTSRQQRVFARLKQLLQARASSTAFHPHGAQRVLQCQGSVFGVLRISPAGDQQVLCLHNVSARTQTLQLDREWQTATDLLATRIDTSDARSPVTLAPYQAVWLTRNDSNQ